MLESIKREFSTCGCGFPHEVTIKDVQVGSGITKDTGSILRRNGFDGRLLVVADENTLKASEGVIPSLEGAGFELGYRIHKNLRVAEMSEVNAIQNLIKNYDGVISVGTGSLHDVARLACARGDKPLCLFATAPSMDGFASYSAPITDGCFKITYPAKSPEVIIADTKILAKAPTELKSAGFGDMVGKYVGLIDWQVSNLVSGEYYCEKVAALTRSATDRIMELAPLVVKDDEQAAAAVFEGLFKTGIAMSLVKNSRPASGTEHILSHFWECKKLLNGELSDFHGKKVGVATLLILKEYERFASYEDVELIDENIDWAEVKNAYEELYPDVEKLNNPPISQEIDKNLIKEHWQKIREIIKSVPSYAVVKERMEEAGCVTDVADISVSEALKEQGLKYHPHMRHRVSLMRLSYLFKGK